MKKGNQAVKPVGQGIAGVRVLDTYSYTAKNIPVTIRILQVPGEFVAQYEISIESISDTTETILERIRQRLIDQINFGILEMTQDRDQGQLEERFERTIKLLIDRYFPESDDKTKEFLTTYLIEKSLGLGNLEIIMGDNRLEEITINDAREPVWVYHKNHGWLKTNVHVRDEEQTRHYAMTIGRKVGRQISVMEPLLDAHMGSGDRVNATLNPVSEGNTITIRRFSRDPWTVTKFLGAKTISVQAASVVWLGMQYELSALIAGGTASGKTSTLNCLATFFQPNQRILSIEDTRELQLPSFLHWVPLQTRQPNAEGKGEISMGDLLVNSLRMRPDRILVGEIRRQREAETLFEAIHTGHSCYATFHANSAQETIDRLTNPPINVPKSMLPAISMVIMQFRNRRSGFRRTFQIAEVTSEGAPNVLLQYDPKKDILVNKNKSKSLFGTLELYTGMTPKEINADLKAKQTVLNYLTSMDIKAVDSVGRVMAEYYTNPDYLFKHVKAKKLLPAVQTETNESPQSPSQPPAGTPNKTPHRPAR
jgi:archaeal flagellar protein FlaI